MPPTDASPLLRAPVSPLLPVPDMAKGAPWAFEIPIRPARLQEYQGESQDNEFPNYLADIRDGFSGYSCAHESTMLRAEIGDFAIGQRACVRNAPLKVRAVGDTSIPPSGRNPPPGFARPVREPERRLHPDPAH